MLTHCQTVYEEEPAGWSIWTIRVRCSHEQTTLWESDRDHAHAQLTSQSYRQSPCYCLTGKNCTCAIISEAMVDVMAAERTFAQLKRTEVGLDLDYEGKIYHISSDDVACSTVLAEVSQTIAEGDIVPVPVDGQVVQLWLSYVHNPAGDGHTRSIEVLVATVQVSETPGQLLRGSLINGAHQRHSPSQQTRAVLVARREMCSPVFGTLETLGEMESDPIARVAAACPGSMFCVTELAWCRQPIC